MLTDRTDTSHPPRGGWDEVLPGVLRWRDSCNVYAVLGPESTLVVDAGSGTWLEALEALPAPPAALALTHYLRDHAAGAAAAARAGIEVWVPDGEAELLRDPAEHFRRRETYLIYDNVWDLHAPIAPTPVAGTLRDHERLLLAGLELEVLPLPGATPTQAGLLVTLPGDGRRVAFVGETIHSHGRVPRLAPLQYDYNDLTGAVNVAFSADLLRGLAPDALLPSLGEPIVGAAAADAALAALRERLEAHVADRPRERRALALIGRDRVERVSERVWISTQARGASCFVLGGEGRALAFDYGYWHPTGAGAIEPGVDPVTLPLYAYPTRRRALPHSLEALREQAGVVALDAVVPTHYHDDHTCGIPLLQRTLGVACWAPESFARLLAEPSAHRFPCTWPQPIRVDRELSLEEGFAWEGIRFALAPMSGHTRFSALIGWEVDGLRFVHAGDQYVPVDDRAASRDWPDHGFVPNHVYANGAFLDSYARSAEWIAAFRPDVVLGGHSRPIRTDAAWFERLERYGREFAQRHLELTALAPEVPHFGLDGMAGWMWPYRVHVPAPQPISFEVTVRNPLPDAATLELRLSGPDDGWLGSRASVAAGPRAEATTRMTIVPAGPCRRQPVAVELHADGRPFGPVLEALVTVGGAAF